MANECCSVNEDEQEKKVNKIYDYKKLYEIEKAKVIKLQKRVDELEQTIKDHIFE
jgi:hypothetical protein